MLAGEYPIAVVCALLGCNRSSYYHPGTPTDETDLEQAIDGVTGEWPTYGSRRVTAQLRRQGWAVNRKRIQRVLRRKGLLRKQKAKVHKTTDSDHDFPRYPNLVADLQVVRPDLVWVSDITYIRLAHEFVYLAVIMDVFTRNIRGWHLGRSLDQSLTLLALQRALVRGKPEIHHSDQGVQYAATTYTRILQSVNVQISMARAGEAWQNGYAERLLRTIKEEEVDLSEYTDYADALRQLGRFLDDVYTCKRIHSALGYLTPTEFEAQWRCEQAAAHTMN
jgi:transposase InsO family protein